MGELDALFAYLSGRAVWWGLLILLVSATIEYVVPPFPGDTVALAGAVLVPQSGWPISGVFGALMLGTAAGVAVDWHVGRWLANRAEDEDSSWLRRLFQRESVASKIRKLDEQFERWGSVYLTLNRFIPAFRALFFVAAGHAGISLRRTLLFGCLGAALYTALLLGAGYAAGDNLELLAGWATTYSNVFFAILGLVVVVWVGKTIVGRWRA